MAYALWRGLLAVLLLSSLCSVPVLAATLTVSTGQTDYTADPGAEVAVSGSVTDGHYASVSGATVTIDVTGTDISVNTTTNEMGLFSTYFTAPLEPGSYSFNVTAVNGGDSGQITRSLTVNPHPPDISVSGEDITFWPLDPVTDTKVLVNATIRNLGDVGANTTIKIFLGVPIGNKPLSEENITVPAGGSVTVSVMWPAESGTHLFTVVADKVDPSDSNLTNNQANNTIEVEDIFPPEISDPVIDPPEPTSADMISVQVSVEDDMGLAEDDPVMLIYAVGEGDEEELPMNGTKGGFLAHIGPFPGGTYVSLKVRATDLSNNSAETDWYRVDIYHSNIIVHVGNLTATAGHNISISCSAEYEDKTPVAGHLAVLVLDEVTYHAITDDNGEAEFNITAPPEAGRYDFTVFINEKRLTANSSAILTVLPVTYPDVIIVQGGVTFSWVNASEVEVTVILYNGGDAVGDVNLEVFLGSPSNGILLNGSRFTMAPGQFLYHSFMWPSQPGRHSLVVIANCSGDAEPGDNIATAEVDIPAQEVEEDTATDDTGTAWYWPHMFLSMGLGGLLSIMALILIIRYMRKSPPSKRGASVGGVEDDGPGDDVAIEETSPDTGDDAEAGAALPEEGGKDE